MKTAITVILIIVAVAAVLFFLPLIIMFNEELDLAVKKGELHRSEDIEKVMTAMLINFKSRLSAIPAEEADKLAAMTDKAKIFLYLNDKIKEALNELSDFEGMFKEEIKDEEGND